MEHAYSRKYLGISKGKFKLSGVSNPKRIAGLSASQYLKITPVKSLHKYRSIHSIFVT
ncbi:hypothetical protein ND2E_0403 [Colwellia psychrerythraea]|uniref:Uncharacterized protein n=1 Tax=Colwellia psychrerythraea TaxID=28229 RepID=A0A099K9H2_COLPS|nr:hypothetical protein ND2E_0403 [Colwellia psychrerythraea]